MSSKLWAMNEKFQTKRKYMLSREVTGWETLKSYCMKIFFICLSKKGDEWEKKVNNLNRLFSPGLFVFEK